jgi:hypothetical protein
LIYIGLNLANFATFVPLGAYAQNLKRIAVNRSTLRLDGLSKRCYNTYIDSNKQENEMTVADLIALLQQLPQDADVWVSQNGGEYLGDMSGDVDVQDGRVTFLD